MRDIEQPSDRPPPGGFGSPIRPAAPPTEAERKAAERERLNREFKRPTPNLPEKAPK